MTSIYQTLEKKLVEASNSHNPKAIELAMLELEEASQTNQIDIIEKSQLLDILVDFE